MRLRTLLGFIDLLFNPFWGFMNFRRIKSNDKRVSDFYDLSKMNTEPEASIVFDRAEIPTAQNKHFKIKPAHKGAL
jgi:hypothetical protein